MARVVVFDSGVGGLSIYQQIKNLQPGQPCIFVSDNQAFPYGTKQEAELQQRVLQVVQRIVDQYSPDILVVACNTASTVVLPLLRKTFQLPIVGVVPAIKPAASLSERKSIGVLATPATINRRYTDDLIEEFAADCAVIRVGSTRLVEIAEDKLAGLPIDAGDIENELQPLLTDDSVDVIVLACTHFPILNNEIQSIFDAKNHQVKLVDSGIGIANRVRTLLDQLTQSDSASRSFEGSLPAEGSQSAAEGSSIAVFTRVPTKGAEFIDNLYNMGLTRTEILK